MSLLKKPPKMQNQHDKNNVPTGETSVTEDSPSSHECFSCKLTGVDLINCSSDSCDKYYHNKCLESLPWSKKKVNLCPLHICSTCLNANPKNAQAFKGNMVQCDKCPIAFHDQEKCTIPGTVGSTCPKHFSPEKHRGYSAIRSLAFCVQCSCNKGLMFCKSCPAAIHKHCLGQKTSSDDFICDRCLRRKTVSFNDVVWAKVFNMRWFPALVVNPNNIPKHVEEFEHFEGEFPIKFFTRERDPDQYYWVQSGRVYPFFYRKLNMDEHQDHHDFKKVIKCSYFDGAVQKALEEMAQKSEVKPTDNSKPPPYKHIKSNRAVGDVQIYTLLEGSEFSTCGCNSEDPSPCGYDSMCLNRGTNTECCKYTCNVGEKCQNKKFQKLEYPPVKPFWTETRGWGLKSVEDIKIGTFVNEYCGDLIDEEEFKRRVLQKQLVGDTNFYFCTLDSNRIIDAGPKGNFSRFMNHSCEPNCEMQKWMVLGDVRIGLFATKDIEAGSELTFDYQMDFSHYDKLKCNCGEKRCSGLIGTKPLSGAFRPSAQKEATEEVSDIKEKIKNKTTKLQKNSRKKDDYAKVKKGNGVAKHDDVKVKKQKKVAKADNIHSSAQKKDTEEVSDIKEKIKDNTPKLQKNSLKKGNSAKIKKRNGVAKDDDVKVKKQKRVAKAENVHLSAQKQKEGTEEVSDIKENVKDITPKLQKNSLKKGDFSKIKKQSVVDEDVKVKKRKRVTKADNFKDKKQKGIAKDGDVKDKKLKRVAKGNNAK